MDGTIEGKLGRFSPPKKNMMNRFFTTKKNVMSWALMGFNGI